MTRSTQRPVAYLRAVGVVAVLAAGCAGQGPSFVTPAATAGPIEAAVANPTPTTIPTATPVPTATPTPTPVPTPTPEPDCVAPMPAEVLIGQLLMPLATPSELATVALLADQQTIGAVALLGSPTAQQLLDLRAGESTGGLGLLIASDEEGGRVQRLAAATVRVPSAQEQATMSPDGLRDLFESYGGRLRELGVDMALAPVVDVGGGPGIGDRSFGSDPQVVIANARAVSEGYLAAGVVPVIKHFPGHGGASQDTHNGIAQTATLDELRERDLVPFQVLTSELAVGVMVGHLLVPGLTDDIPTSLSPEAIDGLLRQELGFDGFVITDALGMGAIAARWDQPTAALMAIAAGADMVILGDVSAVESTREALLAAIDAGDLQRDRVEAAATRVFDIKGVDPCDWVPQ